MENVLASLSNDNALSSWTIFKDNNGYISLKIRYKEGTNVQNCVTEDHFRRKSQRQVMRDRHRSQQWQASRRSNTDGGQHSDQTDTPLSVTEVKIGVIPSGDMAHIASKISCRDVPVCDTSPAVTRRQTRADRAQDTPEIARCDDTDTVASFNMSSVSDLNADAWPFISDALLLHHDVISGRSDTSLPPKCTYEDHSHIYDHNSTDICDTIKPQTITPTEDSDERIDRDSRVAQETLDAASPTSHSKVCATTEWEPPPGWCWACWMDINETGKCAKHA